jgi:nuclear pore complex protein Nup107
MYISITRNMKNAFELVNIVADSRYRIYDDFINEGGRKMSDYLGAVRQAALAGLEGGGSDPFRVLSL